MGAILDLTMCFNHGYLASGLCRHLGLCLCHGSFPLRVVMASGACTWAYQGLCNVRRRLPWPLVLAYWKVIFLIEGFFSQKKVLFSIEGIWEG